MTYVAIDFANWQSFFYNSVSSIFNGSSIGILFLMVVLSIVAFKTVSSFFL